MSKIGGKAWRAGAAFAAYLAEIGSRGGSTTGKSKRRGSKDYYRKLALKSAKARRKSARKAEQPEGEK